MMTSFPPFSVLMTTYGKEHAEWLDISLQSLFEQSVSPSQVVLVLDGPVGEELYAVVRKYQQKYTELLKIVQLPENVGQGQASAEGVKSCSYDLIARMDSDDVCEINRFEKQLTAFQKHPELDVVAGCIAEFTESPNQITYIRQMPENHQDIRRAFRFRNPINNVTVMFRREALERAGGYQPEVANEDFALYVRMLSTDSCFYNIPDILVRVRVGVEMAKRRGDIKIFRAWCRNQAVLLQAHITNLFMFLASCTLCFFFVIIPSSWKLLLYKYVLRKRVSDRQLTIANDDTSIIQKVYKG